MDMDIKTRVMTINDNEDNKKIIKKAGEALGEGRLVAFPTETVYGLGADGLNEKAVKNIFKAKGRPQDNPLILHIASLEMLEKLALDISQDSLRLIEKFWPGPLTIIFKRTRLVPNIITGGLDTVAIRMPENKLARDIIREAKTPIAAPSANTSGRPSPTRASHVYEDLKSRVDYIVDGGTTGIGLESTVIDMSEEVPTILRPGAIGLEDIRRVLPSAVEDLSLVDDSKEIVPKSPGQKYRHYAPNKELVLFVGSNDFMVKSIGEAIGYYGASGKKVGVIATDENLEFYKGARVISLGSQKDKAGIAHNLFDVYRKFNTEDVDIILSESVDEEGLGKAIMNRMKKACGGNIVKER